MCVCVLQLSTFSWPCQGGWGRKPERCLYYMEKLTDNILITFSTFFSSPKKITRENPNNAYQAVAKTAALTVRALRFVVKPGLPKPFSK